MAYFFGVIKQISLGRLLLLLSVIAMTLAFLLIFGLSGMMRDHAIHDLAREDARQTSQLVFQSLYSAMRKGWNKQEINESIARLNDSFPDLKIKVYRGSIVAGQFGEMPNEHAVIAQDSELRRSLETAAMPSCFRTMNRSAISIRCKLVRSVWSAIPNPTWARCMA